ncbi:MAG: hypothetical protein OHK93_007985 [Ramalina farinacea]|uniref:Uncharacterized protein n=1 Tax=Ramalina farinacea TaxID=258253 RepID=A0AA43QN94_9LECA|nr:hypothetical protein [Ramalina farinacea]
MSIPTTSQLHRGVGVRIILKADQPTGKLTTGQIDQLLTRGNHPRGIKVRLTDGQIGRVQSLTSADNAGGQGMGPGQQQDVPSVVEGAVGGEDLVSSFHRRGAGSQDRRGIQDDYRYDDVAADSRSLADYMKAPSKNKARRNKTSGSVSEPAKEQDTEMQGILDSEFATLDSALIAAIVADHKDVAEARNVLRALS